MLSYGGAAIALIMTGPSVLFGAVGKVGAMYNVHSKYRFIDLLKDYLSNRDKDKPLRYRMIN